MTYPVIPYFRWELQPEDNQQYPAHQLRGAFGQLYRHWSVFHQHLGRESLYRHPLVQYKSLSHKLMVVGLGVGAELLAALEPPPMLEINHKNVRFKEIRKISDSYQPDFVTTRPFQFSTPWLALNKDNYRIYREHLLYERKEEIRKLLEKILIGNIISYAKGLSIDVGPRINANIGKWMARPVRARHHGSGQMVGFAAAGTITFNAPLFWGFGKQSSRGNGVLLTEMPQPE